MCNLGINIPDVFVPFIQGQDEDSMKIIFPDGYGVSIIKPKYNVGYEVLILHDSLKKIRFNYLLTERISKLINKPLNQFNTIDNLSSEDVINILMVVKVTDDLVKQYRKELFEEFMKSFD